MALRARLKEIHNARISSEKYYLILWPTEGTVSIHKKNELREPDHKKNEYEESEKQPEATVGSTVSIKFGRKWFEGEILSDGTKKEMLEKEKKFINGEYDPFQKSSDETATQHDKVPSTNDSSRSDYKQSTGEVKVESDDLHRDEVEDNQFRKRRKRCSRRKLVFYDNDNECGSQSRKSEKREVQGEKERNTEEPRIRRKMEETSYDDDNIELDEKSIKKRKRLLNDAKSHSKAGAIKETKEIKQKKMESNLIKGKKKKRKGVILQHGSGPEDCGSSSGESEDEARIKLSHYDELEGQGNRCYFSNYDSYEDDVFETHDSLNGTLEGDISSKNEMLESDCGSVIKNLTKLIKHVEYQNSILARRINALSPNAMLSPLSTPTPLTTPSPVMPAPVKYMLESNYAKALKPLGVVADSTPIIQSNAEPKRIALSACNETPVIKKPVIKKVIAAPPIDKKELISPQKVVEKYPKLARKSKITTLAVRLAKEAYFGKLHMSFCTFKGIGSYPALPEAEVEKMKRYLNTLCVPNLVTSKVEFEEIYKGCVDAVGQACKELRKKRLASENF